MSTFKTKVEVKELLNFLKNYFTEPIKNLKLIKSGEISQAFSFNLNNLNYVIRINRDDKSYLKDKYAYINFKTPNIPIPKIIDIGKFNDKLFFALSEKAQGKNLDEYNEKEARSLIPALINILDKIHKTKVDEKSYGHWDSEGKAFGKSWHEFILNNDYLLEDTPVLKESFLEMDVIKKLIDKLEPLVKFLPEKTYLVHGDYGFNNIVSDGTNITGVLDWGESLYGDFLYDVAWLDFWPSNIEYGEIFKKHYEDIATDIKYYDERLLCYKLKFGIGALHFFAKSNQEGSYIWTSDKLFSLNKTSP